MTMWYESLAIKSIAWHCCILAEFARTTAEDSDEGDWMKVDDLFDKPEAATNGRLSNIASPL